MRVFLLGICNDVHYVDEEIGIAYIASVLKDRGYDVEIKMYSKESVDYEAILSFNPTIIGLSVYHTTYAQAQEISRSLKELSNAYICWGGAFASQNAIEILKLNEFIDFISIGEGEINFLKLVEYIGDPEARSKIPGLAYRNHINECVVNKELDCLEDINNLPFPNRDILKQYKIKAAKIFFSRTCSKFSKVLVRDAKNIVNEIEYIIETFKVNRFDVLDHGFENNEYIQMIDEFIEEIARRNIKIYFYMYVTADFHDKVSDSFTQRLIKSGLCGVYINMGTGNEKDRILYGKLVPISNYQLTLEYLKKNSLHTSISLINFHPYSSFETLRLNIEFLSEYHILSSSLFLSQNLILSRDTPLFEKVSKDGLLITQSKFFEFPYKFSDERVGRLFKFIMNYYNDKGFHKNISSKLNYYIIDYLNLISYLSREFCGDDQAISIVENNELLVREKLNEIAHDFIKWFKSLIELAETNAWSQEKAYYISQDLLDIDALNAKINSMDIYKSKLVLKLFKLNKKYVDYL